MIITVEGITMLLSGTSAWNQFQKVDIGIGAEIPVDSSPLDKKAPHLVDDIFKCIFVNKNFVFVSNFTEVCFWGSNWQ